MFGHSKQFQKTVRLNEGGRHVDYSVLDLNNTLVDFGGVVGHHRSHAALQEGKERLFASIKGGLFHFCRVSCHFVLVGSFRRAWRCVWFVVNEINHRVSHGRKLDFLLNTGVLESRLFSLRYLAGVVIEINDTMRYLSRSSRKRRRRF